jgi:chorismate--pyruvate lyase
MPGPPDVSALRQSPANPPRPGAWLPLRPAAGRSGLAGWLAERGSLTARLRAHCGQFVLLRLGQRAATPHRDETPLLGLPQGRKAWVREVLLLADGVPVVYAHSVARTEVLRGAWRLLARIGGKPVGDAVFARPLTRRGAIEVRHLKPGHPLQRAACAAACLPPDTRLWARRSAFVHAGQALWVSEVFLPGAAVLRPCGRPRRRRMTKQR